MLEWPLLVLVSLVKLRPIFLIHCPPHKHTRTNTLACTQAHTHINTCAHTQRHTCMHAHTQTCTHTPILSTYTDTACSCGISSIMMICLTRNLLVPLPPNPKHTTTLAVLMLPGLQECPERCWRLWPAAVGWCHSRTWGLSTSVSATCQPKTAS